MASNTAQKDVEAILMKERVFRRRPGDVPYPLKYSKEIVNYDHWDHMWLMGCYKGLTMHKFESPPRMVLDLGCGSGLWAVDAARQWPESTIIGLDINAIQPRLFDVGGYSDISRRLKWIQGNLLDGLHFPPDHFDLVRIARIGLGVPEDEWQFVLEEVFRVMKPGGVLEIIEEDLIFPAAEFCRPRTRPAPLTIDVTVIESISNGSVSARSSLASSNPWTQSSQDDLLEFSSKKAILSPLEESPTSLSSPPSTHSLPRSPLSFRSNNSHTHLNQPIPSSLSYQSHPQDHSRLKSAWEAMLSHRFLAPQLVTVLPFYLSSTFTEVKSYPPLTIPLPPNSAGSRRPSENGGSDVFDPHRQFALNSDMRRLSDSDDSSFDLDNSQSRKSVSNWADMHLARTVQVILGCKDAIWVEYEKMYSPDLPPVTTSRRKDGRFQVSSKTIARESFDRAWANWESDMMDRIGMRENMFSRLAWTESPGERPDWRVWRNTVDIRIPSTVEEPLAEKELCRSMRGFVALKTHS